MPLLSFPGPVSYMRALHALPGGVALAACEDVSGLPAASALLAHRLEQVRYLLGSRCPRVLVLHEHPKGAEVEDRVLLRRAVDAARCVVVAPRPSILTRWGIAGHVIPLPVSTPFQATSPRRHAAATVVDADASPWVWSIVQQVLAGHTWSWASSGGLPTKRAQLMLNHQVYLRVAAIDDGFDEDLLYAMGYGMAVVTTPGSGSPVQSGFTGVVADNVGALRRSVARLLQHDDEAAQLGEAARRVISSGFSSAGFAERWSQVVQHAESCFAGSVAAGRHSTG